MEAVLGLGVDYRLRAVDDLVGHLAAAVGTPCVGLFGPVPATRNGPWGAGHVTVEPPAGARPPWHERKTDTRSMAAIDVAAVVSAAATLLSAGLCRVA